MQKTIIRLIGLFLLVVSTLAHALTIYHNKSTSANDDMNIALLKLVAQKADPNIQVLSAPQGYTDSRAISELEAGNLSVIWTMTSIENESRMLPIRYCVIKGLPGYRIFIIRQGDQPKYNAVHSLNDLKLLKAGQGNTWVDTSILRHAGLNVVTTTKYQNLFPMLDGGRFDYFPRGIFEPWGEIPAWSQYPLTVEQNILLHYPTALYFFVKKDNHQLANLLTQGFEKAIADGSYDEIFYRSPPVVQAVKQSNMTERRVIQLDNPLLPQKTPLERKELWFDIEAAKRIQADL